MSGAGGTAGPPPKVAILAGGLATRLRPVTETIPKSLVDVAGEPFIAHQLRLLARAGIAEVVVCTGHLGEQIEAEIGGGAAVGVHVAYAPDGPQPLGTAGALRQALPRLGEGFLVLYGDSYLDCDYLGVWRAFQASGKPGLMTAYRNEGRFERSNMHIDGGVVRAYDKRAPTSAMRHVDYGLLAFRAGALAALPAGQPGDLGDLCAALVARGDMAVVEIPDRFYEIGSFAGLEETRRLLEGRAGSGA